MPSRCEDYSNFAPHLKYHPALSSVLYWNDGELKKLKPDFNLDPYNCVLFNDPCNYDFWCGIIVITIGIVMLINLLEGSLQCMKCLAKSPLTPILQPHLQLLFGQLVGRLLDLFLDSCTTFLMRTSPHICFPVFSSRTSGAWGIFGETSDIILNE